MDLSFPFVIIIGAVLLYLFFRIIRLPLKWLWKLFIHAVVGFCSLFVLNFIGSWVGIYLDMSLFNALIAGILGLPGVVLLLVLKYFL